MANRAGELKPAMSDQPWSYPLFAIKRSDEFYSLWGEAPSGEDVSGVPVFGNRPLAEQQLQDAGIAGTVVELIHVGQLQEFVGKLDTNWLFYFEDEESEMWPVAVSQVV